MAVNPLAAAIEKWMKKLTPEERSGQHPAGFLVDADDPVGAEPVRYGQSEPERPEWMASQEKGWNMKTARRIGK